MSGTSLYWEDPKDIVRLVQLLKSGNVCIGTSDTVIGLLAPLTIAGRKQLDFIKKRSKKPYIVLVGSFAAVEHIVQLPKDPYLRELLATFWPGPLTVILQIKSDRLKLFQVENNTIAVRVPNHSGLQQLLQHIDGVFSTSANKAGEPIPIKLKDVNPEILQHIACTITEREAKETVIPSTIIDCSQEKLTLLRQGAIPFDELTKFIESAKTNL